jgi:hypothetical protein
MGSSSRLRAADWGDRHTVDSKQHSAAQRSTVRGLGERHTRPVQRTVRFETHADTPAMKSALPTPLELHGTLTLKPSPRPWPTSVS